MDITALSPQDITAYLKKVVETESSLFKQQMMKKEAEEKLRNDAPQKRHLEKPQKRFAGRPSKPENGSSAGFGIIAAFCFVLGIPFIQFGGFYTLMAWALVFLGAFMLFYMCVYSSGSKNEKERYYQAMTAYEKRQAELDKEYEQAMLEYNQKIKAEEERYQLTLERYPIAQQQVALLDGPLAETESILQSLYDTEILFPKYRNFPAVCMFYEYFASGRCSKLAGPNGAYNLYESELRQNLIINQLDTIMGSLEGIKQNQFILYTEAKKTADALPGISRDITNMLDISQQITRSAAIAAQCAEATQTNTEALKYLAFIKR